MLTFEKSTEPVARKLKVLVYGAPKTGKTWFSIHAPAPLVIDTESSTDAYRGRPDMPPFSVAKSAQPSEIIPVLEQLQKVGYIKAEQTLRPETIVVDSFSVLWQVRQEAGQKLAEARARKAGKSPDEAKVAFGDWSVIKKPINRLYNLLINMPVHVIITAREKDLYDEDTNQPKKIGHAPDIERNAPYVFDLVLRLVIENGARVGIVEGSRFAEFPPGTRVVNPSWQTFAHLARGEGAPSSLPDVDGAAEAEARTDEQPAAWLSKPSNVQRFQNYLEEIGLTEEDANRALGHHWRRTTYAAENVKAIVNAYKRATYDGENNEGAAFGGQIIDVQPEPPDDEQQVQQAFTDITWTRDNARVAKMLNAAEQMWAISRPHAINRVAKALGVENPHGKFEDLYQNMSAYQGSPEDAWNAICAHQSEDKLASEDVPPGELCEACGEALVDPDAPIAGLCTVCANAALDARADKPARKPAKK
ncbi:MAG: hypothetical protein BroJett042_31600 [Bacteroidota bacterium]|nr:MAG: hypothetical protein BroJett042_31600 [Bacteroidota bacterium]